MKIEPQWLAPTRFLDFEADDLPYRRIAEEMQETFPQLVAASQGKLSGDFEHEAIHVES